MQKAAPSFGRIAVMAGFALSCFGLLLFLWLAFGGSIPLKPKGYRFVASFSEATQLAQEADVRISGVPVGKVKTIEPDKKTGRSNVDDPARLALRAAALRRQGDPAPEDAAGRDLRRADARHQGGRTRSPRAVGCARRRSRRPSSSTRSSARSTRARATAFQVWMQTQAQAIKGHGRDVNDALGNLGPFAEDASVAVDILNRQEGALRRLISNTGVVFGALTERGDQLRGLIENSNAVFATTAARDRELQEAFVALPTFERESRVTVNRLDEFAAGHEPARDPAAPGRARVRPDARGPVGAGARPARAVPRPRQGHHRVEDRLPGGGADPARPAPAARADSTRRCAR